MYRVPFWSNYTIGTLGSNGVRSYIVNFTGWATGDPDTYTAINSPYSDTFDSVNSYSFYIDEDYIYETRDSASASFRLYSWADRGASAPTVINSSTAIGGYNYFYPYHGKDKVFLVAKTGSVSIVNFSSGGPVVEYSYIYAGNHTVYDSWATNSWYKNTAYNSDDDILYVGDFDGYGTYVYQLDIIMQM